MPRIGLELTFVPDRKGDKEFPSEAQAGRAADKLWVKLIPINKLIGKYGTRLDVKVERFRRVADGQPTGNDFKSWIIEITNGPYPADTIHWKDPKFVRLVQRVFNAARKLKLIPRIRRRGLHHPTGGGHLVCGIPGLFGDSTHFLPRLAVFERNLYVDIANRPYIRWLFAEWFDDLNSLVTVTLDGFGNFLNDEYVYAVGLTAHSIRRRFSCDMKTPYAAYQHRYFDAQTCAKDIVHNVAFVEAWMNHHVNLALLGKEVHFTLTRDQFKRFKNVRHAWSVISTFLRELGLDSVNYRAPFEDNYIPRMRHGTMT